MMGNPNPNPAPEEEKSLRDELLGPILLAKRVIKLAQEAESPKVDCKELASRAQVVYDNLRSVVRVVSGTQCVNERPIRRIVGEVSKSLERTLAFIRKCKKHGGVLRQVFSMTTTANFLKVWCLLESSGGDLIWLLTVLDSKNGIDLSLPPIATNDPILAWVWTFTYTLQLGQPKDRIEAATVLGSLARDNERRKFIILDEGGVMPLLKLLKEASSPDAQVAAANALVDITTNQDRVVTFIVESHAVPIIVQVLGDSPMRVRVSVANLVSAMAEQHELAREEFVRANVTRLLVSLLSMDTGTVLTSPELRNEVKVSCAKALWKLSNGCLSSCRKITETKGLLCLANNNNNGTCTFIESNQMESEIVESTDMADITADARSFSWTVDSAIKSEPGSISGESPIRSYSFVVNNYIRSRTASDLGTSPSPVHSLASAVANAMSSSSAAPFSQLETSPSPVQSLASAVPSAMSRSKAAPFSQLEVVPNATRHVPARLFTWAELKAATNNFSPHNLIRDFRIFGDGYRGKLVDGREVAIVKETPFGKSEFAIFSRLDHRNLVGLVGYCENRNGKQWVYEYMKNGSLHDCLQDKNNVDKDSSVLNSWKMRIKIALDASLGIQYLHNYANPSIIHRDIKSSNILLDASWTARVFDFGLSFICPEPDDEYDDERIVGTYAYMCPEYAMRGVLTAKCDVYGLGVVLLELLTGKSAIRNNEKDVEPSFSLVHFAVPRILAGDLVEILDSRVGPPDLKEAEALKILAYTAICCVKREGRHRPTMNDIVVNLDRAFAICGSSLYGENFSYSNAIPSHESNHMSPYPLHLEEFFTRPESIPLSYWDIYTDSCDIPIYQEDTDSDNFSCGTMSDLDISDY